MSNDDDLPPALRDENAPQPLSEELPLEEVPEPAAEPKAQTPPPAEPYLRRS